jgi:nicotinamide-nucleotide amidase
MPLKKRLEIISLGDELLLGMRDNAQLTYLGRELARKGLSIARDQEIRDNAEEIQRHFLENMGARRHRHHHRRARADSRRRHP